MANNEDTGTRLRCIRRPFDRHLLNSYLGSQTNLCLLLCIDAYAFLIGINFYVLSSPSLSDISPIFYPLFGDSPTALALAALSVATLIPLAGTSLDTQPSNTVVEIIHTLAFVWLLKSGLWTIVALNLRLDLYFGFSATLLWEYWGIMLTHALFILQASTIPYYAKTNTIALVSALVLLLLNDLYDYGFGMFPPLRYDPGLILATLSVFITLSVVGIASWIFDRHTPAQSGE
ncbi:MAG: putative membrane protein [Haloquadratum sp. J07HQX50]|nr:MAG: putative membrane protein [Haloquadratum sp. J07HQX50]